MPGVSLLATRSGAPVLPVGISGSERTWPIGARRPHFGTTVTVRFGPVLDLRASGRDEGSEAMMRAVAALLPPSYRGRFDRSDKNGAPGQHEDG
jgi:1-acyl-sn-glycerol-3-phosphate acyltransferase